MVRIDELLDRTLILVAHPDDECIAFGGLMQRIREPIVVFATDGSPEDSYFWKDYGSREAYAALRRSEAANSIHAAGGKEIIFLSEIPGGESLIDQQLFRNLPRAYHLVSDVVHRRMVSAILTLAYEGGHPDHDSCSLLASVLAKRHRIPCWEAPLYHRVKDGSGTFQDFIEHSADEVDIVPTPSEQAIKREMCRAYPSQGDFLTRFDVGREHVRPQRAYDYTRPPHAGKTNYEVWQWSMSAGDVCEMFAEFLQKVESRGQT